jgi:hypothetical protein
VDAETEPRAVLITGVYGTGKSSLAAEIADILEARDLPYAAIDLDWLSWANVGAHGSMLLTNLRPVVANYLAAGITHFVLAGTISTTEELEGIRATIEMPLRVVRLTLPLAEIARRLGADVTTGRRDDLRQAADDLAVHRGEGIEDLTVPNDRPIRDVATEVLAWLAW